MLPIDPGFPNAPARRDVPPKATEQAENSCMGCTSNESKWEQKPVPRSCVGRPTKQLELASAMA